MCSRNETIQRLREVARNVLPQNGRAILFGSQARGDAHSSSDWDVLIIIDKDKLVPNDYDTITYPITMLGWEIGEEINPILYTTKEWTQYQASPFCQNVEREGINLLTA